MITNGPAAGNDCRPVAILRCITRITRITQRIVGCGHKKGSERINYRPPLPHFRSITTFAIFPVNANGGR
jgi:hypothetical protein